MTEGLRRQSFLRTSAPRTIIYTLMTFAALAFPVTAALAQSTDPIAPADQTGQSDHMMGMDAEGMVMNENKDRLPQDCSAISEDVHFKVLTSTKLARTGLTYGFDQNEWRVKPCSRVTVTLINDDQVRHQWMIHGLPKYLYPQGMFHLEVSGGFQKTGTFIVPSDEETLLVHCDVSHHMEQGLKGQLVIGSGGRDIPGIPGLTAPRFPDTYPD